VIRDLLNAGIQVKILVGEIGTTNLGEVSAAEAVGTTGDVTWRKIR
jgi:ABC-type arginine/histidine transport system permease subunit